MENELKQVLCVATTEEGSNYSWEKQNIDSRIGVVDRAYIQRLEAQGIEFTRNSPAIIEGMVFGLHPYKQNCYIDLAMSESEVLNYKVDLLAQFCKYLGVTSMTFKAELKSVCKRDLKADAQGNYKVVKVGATYLEEEERKKVARYERCEKYSGDFTEEEYAKAEEMYKKIGYNYKLEHFLKQRNPKDKNKLLSQEIEVELADAMNSLTDVGFTLSTMAGVFGLSANLLETISIERNIQLKMKFEF